MSDKIVIRIDTITKARAETICNEQGSSLEEYLNNCITGLVSDSSFNHSKNYSETKGKNMSIDEIKEVIAEIR